MNVGGLKNVASVLRRDSLKMTTAAGSGHPSSCLSAAEVMSVLFFDEMKYDVGDADNPNNDEFILSKGHAAPVLYSALKHSGCVRGDLGSLRKLSSKFEGHPVPRSISWIKVGTGSLGQGLGVGVGMALAARLQKRKFRTYVLMGDSESAEGSVFEAMELASYYKLDNLVAIVDLNRLGQRGETLLGHNVAAYKKRFLGFGWDVFVVDGHDVTEIKSAFSKARRSSKPVMILAKTFKGRGVSSIENKENWHGKALNKEELAVALEDIGGVKKISVKIKKPRKVGFTFKRGKLKMMEHGGEVSTREAYGEVLANLALSDGRVVAVDAEVSNSTFSGAVKKKSPDQFVEAFIAEQNMVGMASGLVVKGYTVFASTFAAFFSRAHDQIRMAAVSDIAITFVGSHAGVSIGSDGVSQMGLEDVSIFRDLLGSIVFYPSDSVSSEALTVKASKLGGIKYIRTTRGKTPVVYKSGEVFPLGDFKVVRQSLKDTVVLVGSGVTFHEALIAYEKLLPKVKVALVDLYCVKPFNIKKFIKFVKGHGGRVVLAEDHYREGGIGEMVSSGLAGSGIQIKHLCVRKLPHSGTPEELLEKYKIDSKAYVRAVRGKW